MIAVTDHLPLIGPQTAVVVAGGDLITDQQPHPGIGHHRGAVLVEFSGLDPVVLGEIVQSRDGVVVRGQHHHALPAGTDLGPVVQHVKVHLARHAPVEATVLLVDVEGVGVALAEGEGGVSFPRLGETVDPAEFDGGAVFDQPIEHPTPTYRQVLQRVTDQHHPPPPPISQHRQLGERRRGHHCGLIHQQRRTSREPVAGRRAPEAGGVRGATCGRCPPPPPSRWSAPPPRSRLVPPRTPDGPAW